MDQILCPVDFSVYSINALEYAAELIKVRTGKVTLIHIFDEDDFLKLLEGNEGNKSFDQLKNQAQEKLQTIASQLRDRHNINVDYTMSIGEIENAIARYASKNDYDYIVMGTKGVSAESTRNIGSFAARTMSESQIPTLIIPIGVSFQGLRTVVYASDYSKEDKIVLQRLVSLLYNFRSRIKFLHIVHSIVDVNKVTYENFVEELKTFVPYDKISYYLEEYDKDVSQGIEEFVDREKAELLVLLKRKRGFIEKIISKSISKEISYFSTHPILVFHKA